jgi:chromosome segregation ATPase
MNRRYLLLFALLPLALVLVTIIPRIKAETSPHQQATQNATAELVELLKIWKLINAVSPAREQSVPLLAKFNDLEDLKTRYRQEHRRAMNRLKQLQAAEIDSEAKIADLKAALEQYHQVEDQFITQRKKIKGEINQILTVEQQAKFEVFSYSYRQDLKKTLQTLIALQELGDRGNKDIDKSSVR